MSEQSWLRSFQTWRVRLMLWNALAVILTGLGILIAVREGVRQSLEAELDSILREDAKEISLRFEEEAKIDWAELREALDRKARGHKLHGWFIQFQDLSDQPDWKSSGTPENLQKTEQLGTTIPIPGFRLLWTKLSRPAEAIDKFCIGSSTKWIDDDMRRIDQLASSAFLMVLLVAPVSGYILAGRATEPLQEIISTTERLRPTKLDERLRIRGTGDELDAVASTVNRLLDRIGDYLQQKQDFVANAAHELRTPLTAIRSSVEVALSGKRNVKEYEELLAQVIGECDALESLVGQLLLLAETDADRLKVDADKVPLHQIVKRAISMFEAVAEDQQICLTTEISPVSVVGNAHHLRQVVNNFIDNAIKYTVSARETGGAVHVSLEANEEQGKVFFRVKDNGEGIPADAIPNLFKRFFRVTKSRTRGEGPKGTGLGLSICDAIVRAHQGQIRVESKLGEGSTFTVELPIAPPVYQPDNVV